MNDELNAIRELANDAINGPSTIGALVMAVEMLCDVIEELQGHHHTYSTPGDSCPGSHWAKTTTPQYPPPPKEAP